MVKFGLQQLAAEFCEKEIYPAMVSLTKFSFDEEYRHTSCQLGKLGVGM